MKRFTALLLLILLLAGCSMQSEETRFTFYYPRAQFRYNEPDGVIAGESRESGGMYSAAELLNIYLLGPIDERYANPFPEGLSVRSVYTRGDTIQVTVTDELATLSGAPLILACACVGKTAMALTGAEKAEIRCENLLLDGKSHITISKDSVIYTDALPS